MAIESCDRVFTLGGHELTLRLAADENGLRSCRLNPDVEPMPSGEIPARLAGSLEQLQQYFNGEKSALAGKYVPLGTPFQQSVWLACSRIAPGEVASYGELARQIGNPGGMRAVAQALGANPLPLFIPCHRVIRSDGSLGGFSCGLHWKKLLLAHEGYRSEAEWH